MESRAKRSWFLRITSVPVRALCKVRDSYVKSLKRYGDRMNHVSVGTFQVASQDINLPKSFSVGSVRSHGNEDYRELVRAASARVCGERGSNLASYVKQPIRAGSDDWPRAVKVRSSSVAMGRIDEDKPCCNFGEENGDDHGGDVIRGKNGILYPRSKSHAVVSVAS